MSRAQTLAKARAQTRNKPQPRTPPETAGLLTVTKLKTILCVLLASVTIALYSPVSGYLFVHWDDDTYVTANPHIQNGLAWSTIKWAFTSTETAAYWHPLTWLSHALDYQLFALNPAGHHLDSVLIHALNAVLLFLLLAWVTKRVGPSLLVAALFALHPINVESVAWVAERKNVLSTLFFFLAIAAYAWYVQKPGWRRYLLVAGLFAAGLMAKPMVITLPFVLLLLDYWPLERMPLNGTESGLANANGLGQMAFSRLLLEKIPLLVLSAASAWITLRAQRPAEGTFEAFPFAIRIENAVVAYGLYLWKMLWPARLAAFYPHHATTLPMWQVILFASILAGVSALVVAFRRKRYLPAGWFWFLGTLVPVIGLVQAGEQAMADRFAYVPLIGIFVMIAWGLDDWAEARKIRVAWRILLALCALTVLGCVTHRQMSYWDSEYTLWSHALAVTEPEGSAHAHDALGAALLNPRSAMTQHDLENFDTEQKRMNGARRHYEEALKIDRQLLQQHPDANLSDMALALNNLGFLDRIQNRVDDERRHYEEALKIDRQLLRLSPAAYLPKNVAAATLNNLGSLDRRQNRMDDARLHYDEAAEIDRQLAQQNPEKYLPDLAEALNNLGLFERLQKRLDEARPHDEEALKIDRKLAEQDPGKYRSNVAGTLINLGNLDILQNRMDDGRQHFEEALEIYRQLARQNPATYLPDLGAALNNLGNLDLLQNRTDDARRHLDQALDLRRQLAQQNPERYLPDLAGALNNLGNLDKNQRRIKASRAYYTEALTIYQKLAQGNPARYAGEVAKAEASLQELDRKANSR
ncbi:MAG: tetratricopeptide repeat protein [Terriglobales bacterium]